MPRLNNVSSFNSMINAPINSGGFGFTPTINTLSRQMSIYSTSLEHKSHQGLASCRLIKSFVENYKCLKEVAIVLKSFLATMGLNSPYHGKYISNWFLICFEFDRWSIILFNCVASCCLHERIRSEDERCVDTFTTFDGLPGLL